MLGKTQSFKKIYNNPGRRAVSTARADNVLPVWGFGRIFGDVFAAIMHAITSQWSYQ